MRIDNAKINNTKIDNRKIDNNKDKYCNKQDKYSLI